jgi:multidrug efflux pump subunit AcrA (membrane-fusion protein)
MSFSTEPTATTSNPPHDSQGNGYTPPGPLATTARGPSAKTLPGRGRGSRLIPLAIIGVLLLAAAAVGGWFAFFRKPPARADVLLHTVKKEPLIVSVTEKGTLESAANIDIVCKVRAGAKGFASTINWVIDDGTRVKPGQLLMILDDSALKDQEEDQQIKVQAALATKIKAENDYEITVKQNRVNIKTAEAALIAAENALKNYTGLTYDPTRGALAALGGGPVALTEAGTFRQSVDDLSGQVRLAESTVEQNRDRAGWADRMVKLSYLSPAQAQAEKSRLDSSVEDLRSKKAKLNQLLNSDRDQTLTNLILTRDKEEINVEKVKLESDSNLAKAQAEKQRATSEYLQQDEKLRDIIQQRAECKIVAPDTIEPDSMVVYFKQESNRFSSTQQGMIEQGAQVKEGQKMLRIPNLHRMQVNTKVHEAMVARIRGDVRIPTHVVDGVRSVMMLNTDPFGRLVGERPEVVDRVREQFRNYEYKKISDGQRANVRVDALPDHTFEGHVRTVANVASQADSWISDVKLYQTLVLIDYEVFPDGTKKRLEGEQLKPDMTAEVTITVDTAREPVLTVPVQAIIGGTDMGAKRQVFVKTPTGGYERRDVVLGLYNEKAVEIREGLKENEEVVLNPKVLLAPEDKTRTRDGGGNGNGNGEKAGKGGAAGPADGGKGPAGGKGPGGKGGKKKGGGGGPGGPPGGL